MAIHDTTAAIALVGEYPGVHRVWLWRNVIVIAWYGKPSGPATREIGAITDRVLVEYGMPLLSFVHVIANKLELPNADTRTALLHNTERLVDRTACVAVVLSGAGFWASAMRSFVTGFRVLAPRSFDLRVHAAALELLDWFPAAHLRRTGVELEPTELIAQLRVASAERGVARVAG
jgi:hypothetical protein